MYRAVKTHSKEGKEIRKRKEGDGKNKRKMQGQRDESAAGFG